MLRTDRIGLSAPLVRNACPLLLKFPLQSKGDYKAAIDNYGNAVDLYVKTRRKVGLSYTASELCFCYAETGDRDGVRYYSDMVLSLLDSVPYDNVKSYCLKKINEALEKIKD